VPCRGAARRGAGLDHAGEVLVHSDGELPLAEQATQILADMGERRVDDGALLGRPPFHRAEMADREIAALVVGEQRLNREIVADADQAAATVIDRMLGQPVAPALLGYSPLGQGYLTGKYADGALPADSRKTLFDRLGRYEKANGPKAISTYVALARKHGLDPAQMAIAFAASRPFVTSCIIGATTLAQLKTDIAALDLKLPEHVLADIEQIHLDYPNPCP